MTSKLKMNIISIYYRYENPGHFDCQIDSLWVGIGVVMAQFTDNANAVNKRIAG